MPSEPASNRFSHGLIFFGKVRKNAANPPDDHYDQQHIGIDTD